MALPSGCLWTGLRPVEGFKYDEALTELKKIYCTAEDIDMEDEDSPYALPESVPGSIREMARDKLVIEALGSMLWYVRFPSRTYRCCLMF
jgi:DNA mismatch repair protein MSH6